MSSNIAYRYIKDTQEILGDKRVDTMKHRKLDKIIIYGNIVTVVERL